MHNRSLFAVAVALCGIGSTLTSIGNADSPTTAPATQPAVGTQPQVGEAARDFTLKTVDDQEVTLSKLTAEHNVVMVMLRGWPGYQCPFCTKQVGDLVKHKKELDEANATVLLIYPGPADELKKHAEDFAGSKNLPASFHFVTDPDFVVTNQYGLRWNAPKETAYPSTFVIDQSNTVRFDKVNIGHGGRASAEEVVTALKALK